MGLTASLWLPGDKTVSSGHDLSVVLRTLLFCCTPLHGSIRAGQVATMQVISTVSPFKFKRNGPLASTIGCNQPTSSAESSTNCFPTASWKRGAPE